MTVDYSPEQLTLQPRLAAANINPASFLATDYLNHYNEIVMMLEMIPDMPELLEDASDWQPKSYPDHFRDSGFQQRDLAIEAFEGAPKAIRLAFDRICGLLDQNITGTLAGLAHVSAADRGLSDDARALVRKRVLQVQELLMTLNGVIHGKLPEEASADNTSPVTSENADDNDNQTQDDIDKLFD